jgi:hypothetical protein
MRFVEIILKNTIERRKIDDRQSNFPFYHQLIMQYGYLNEVNW